MTAGMTPRRITIIKIVTIILAVIILVGFIQHFKGYIVLCGNNFI